MHVQHLAGYKLLACCRPSTMAAASAAVACGLAVLVAAVSCCPAVFNHVTEGYDTVEG